MKFLSQLQRLPATDSGAGQNAIQAFDAQRRLTLLRILVPGFLGINLISSPLAIYSDLQGALQGNLTNGSGVALNFHFYGTIQNLLGLTGFICAAFALRQRRINLAAGAFVSGILVNILALILTDAFLPGPLALRSIPEFALLLIPIALVGILGDAVQTFAMIACAAIITLGIFVVAPHDQFLRETLEQSDGFAVILIPITMEIALGVIIFAAARALRQTQRELLDVRSAFERERELDRLKEQFISNVNHELRTPIMTLQGYITIGLELAQRGEITRRE